MCRVKLNLSSSPQTALQMIQVKKCRWFRYKSYYMWEENVAGWSLNFDAPLDLTWCVWSVWQTEWRRSLFVAYLLLLLLFFAPLFLPSCPPFPSLTLLVSVSSSSVLVIHRVDASQSRWTTGLVTTHFSLSPPRHPSRRNPTEAVWSLIFFPLIRCESGWINSPRARGILHPCDPHENKFLQATYFIPVFPSAKQVFSWFSFAYIDFFKLSNQVHYHFSE